MRIIIDAMGGDNAPEQIVKGAVLASAELDVDITLVGDEKKIAPILEDSLSELSADDRERVKASALVKHTEKVLTMEDDPMSVIKDNRDSSMGLALDTLAQGEGDALISAGNTGALLCGSTFIVKRIKGIKRAALGGVIPLGKKKLLCDSGSNAEVKPEYLVQFAMMGSIYMNYVFGVKEPTVALLNNGTEECKGTEMHKEAHKLLSESGLNFVGNVEGRDLCSDTCADVVVCDGFSGNVALKSVEGCGGFFKGVLAGMFKKNLRTKLAYLLLKNEVADFKKSVDYKENGGAPFLGIAKTVVKAHGSSDARAIYSTVKQVKALVEKDLIGEIRRRIEEGSPSNE